MDASLNTRLQSEIIKRLKSTNKYEQFVKDFSQCSSDSQRVSCLYRLPECHEVIKPLENYKTKDKREAEILRADGNKFFKDKNYLKAHEVYTKSILKAPVDSENVSLAYNNRSLTNFYMKRYELCLQDIELAFLHNYPKTNCYKLYQRLGKCMYYLQHKEEAIKAFQQTVVTLKCANIEEETKQEMVEDMNRAISQCSAIQGKPVNVSINLYNCSHQGFPALSSDTNNEVPCLSNSVEVKLDNYGGRGLFAVRDISIGDILIIESPFTSVLLKEFNLTHCQYCCNRLSLAIPCQQCSGVVFCSLECRAAAWKNFHYAECKILDSVQDNKGDLSTLAMRMVLTAGYEKLINIQDFRQVSRINGYGEDGMYRSEDYGACYSLVHHAKDRPFENLLSKTISAVYLLKHLELVGFFNKYGQNSDYTNDLEMSKTGSVNCPNNDHETKGENILSLKTLSENTSHDPQCIVGGHILRNLMMLPCNAHEVSELALNQEHPAMSVTVELAAAIYPVLSLINHSCDPSVVRHSFGNVCVTRAIRSIKAGEELKDNYGALYPTMNLATRQNDMKSQYFFSCTCEACANDWPQYFDIPCEIPVFRCIKCDGCVPVPDENATEQSKCLNCGDYQDISGALLQISQMESLYRETLQSVIDGNDSYENVTTLLSYLRLVEGKVHRPWRDINDCQEAFKQCLNMQANCYPLSPTTPA